MATTRLSVGNRVGHEQWEDWRHLLTLHALTFTCGKLESSFDFFFASRSCCWAHILLLLLRRVWNQKELKRSAAHNEVRLLQNRNMMPQVQEDDMGHGGCEAPEATAPENLLTMNSFEKKRVLLFFLVVFFFRYLTSYLCFLCINPWYSDSHSRVFAKISKN